MKNKIIISIIAAVLLSGLGYQSFGLYQMNNDIKAIKLELASTTPQSEMTFQVLNIMGTQDKDGITGFDRLVAQALNKINNYGKKK